MIIGKANLSEFANSGSYSDSGYGRCGTRSSRRSPRSARPAARRSRPRSASPAFAHGHADRRLALRALDRRVAGLAARHRRHLLRRGRDAADVAAGLRGPDRPHDVATSRRILNVTTGTDPDDIATVHADADAKRPADWKTALDPNALQGKQIGYVPAAFDASPELRPGRRHGRRAQGALRRHRRRGRDDGPDHGDRAERRPRPAR